MKLPVYIFSLFLLGCSQGQPGNSVLAEAETVVDHEPYKAIQLLNAYGVDSFSTQYDKALYGLVFTEALHNIGLSSHNSELIVFSQRYFDSIGDNRRRVRAMLHSAITEYGQGRMLTAVQQIKQAERLAAGQDDNYVDYYLASVMGDINDNAHNTKLTLCYYRRALAAAQRSGNAEWRVRAMNNLASAFDAAGVADSMQYYIDRARPLIDSVKGETRSMTMVNMASRLVRDGKQPEAVAMIMKAQQEMPCDKGYKLLADIYAEQGDTAAACDLWYQVLYTYDTDVQIKSYQSLIAHFWNHRDYFRTSDLSRRLNAVYENNYVKNQPAEVIDVQTQWDMAEKERSQYRKAIALMTVAILLLCVIIAVVFYHRWYINRLNRTIEQLNARYMGWNMEEQLMTAAPVAHLHRLAARGQEATDSDWAALHQLMTQQAPTLLARLSSTGALTTKELNVCLLIRLRFIPSEIGTLTSTSPQTITNMRGRLLLKLFGEHGGARDFDAKMREL